MGLAAGVVFGVAGTRSIGHYVAAVRMPGPLSFVVSALIILAAAILASTVPAIRTSRINAMEALRSE